jgi:hypothetical protein
VKNWVLGEIYTYIYIFTFCVDCHIILIVITACVYLTLTIKDLKNEGVVSGLKQYYTCLCSQFFYTCNNTELFLQVFMCTVAFLIFQLFFCWNLLLYSVNTWVCLSNQLCDSCLILYNMLTPWSLLFWALCWTMILKPCKRLVREVY